MAPQTESSSELWYPLRRRLVSTEGRHTSKSQAKVLSSEFNLCPSEHPTVNPIVAPSPRNEPRRSEVILDSNVYEFGGPIGVSAIIVAFPLLMLYLFSCLDNYDGKLVMPISQEFLTRSLESVKPNWHATKLYLGFCTFQAFLSSVLPGVVVKGLPVASLNGRQLEYLCNGIASWYSDAVVLTVLHWTGTMPLTVIIDNVGALLTVSILTGITLSITAYAFAVLTKTTHRMSGNLAYDFFMGASLNPRIGNLDLKMYSEIRIPWKLLFLITLSAAIKEHEVRTEEATLQGLPSDVDVLELGFVKLPVIRTGGPLLFMTVAHFLYANACMKGEECIPTTWDIFYEKWGFMLIFWNFSGVPFSYCYSTLYLLNRSMNGTHIEHSPTHTAIMFAMLLAAYYIWDTANSQKNRFRMMERGTFIQRRTFPQLPGGTLSNPSYLLTKQGNKLLIGGWWGVARKIHYTADLVMALSWGLITGFDSIVPYFYPIFFLFVLTHRVSRDMKKCKIKYGDDWDEYCKIVPYVFVPFIY